MYKISNFLNRTVAHTLMILISVAFFAALFGWLAVSHWVWVEENPVLSISLLSSVYGIIPIATWIK